MKNLNASDYPSLFNLLNLVDVTNEPIIVHDDDVGEDYDITPLIKEAKKELGMA